MKNNVGQKLSHLWSIQLAIVLSSEFFTLPRYVMVQILIVRKTNALLGRKLSSPLLMEKEFTWLEYFGILIYLKAANQDFIGYRTL